MPLRQLWRRRELRVQTVKRIPAHMAVVTSRIGCCRERVENRYIRIGNESQRAARLCPHQRPAGQRGGGCKEQATGEVRLCHVARSSCVRLEERSLGQGS